MPAPAAMRSPRRRPARPANGRAASPVSSGRTQSRCRQHVARHLQPYLDAVRRENAGDALGVYPGSPAIALGLMRPQDTLIANELHPEERAAPRGGHRRPTAGPRLMALDAWVALKSLAAAEGAPRRRADRSPVRGERRARPHGRRAWRRGCSVSPPASISPGTRSRTRSRSPASTRALAALAIPKSLRVELMLQRPSDPERLNGCGLIVVNPPYTLEGELAAVLPELSRRLASTRGGAQLPPRLDRTLARRHRHGSARAEAAYAHQAVKCRR